MHCDKCKNWNEEDRKNCAVCMVKRAEQKCQKCGSTDFWVNESYTWKAYIEDGEMYCSNPNSEVDSVMCKKCDTPFDIGGMEYNFN